MNAHTRAEALRLLTAMNEALSSVEWEDDAQGDGESEAYFAAYDKLRALLSADDVPDGTWRCTQCGEAMNAMDAAWRWRGDVWQHHHADAGHVDARLFSSGVATVPDGYVLVSRDRFILRNAGCSGYDECRWCGESQELLNDPPWSIQHTDKCPLAAAPHPPNGETK